jgi:hypothetical protein
VSETHRRTQVQAPLQKRCTLVELQPEAIQGELSVQLSVTACEKSFITFARLPLHLEPSVAAADSETEVLHTFGKMCPSLCATPYWQQKIMTTLLTEVRMMEAEEVLHMHGRERWPRVQSEHVL